MLYLMYEASRGMYIMFDAVTEYRFAIAGSQLKEIINNQTVEVKNAFIACDMIATRHWNKSFNKDEKDTKQPKYIILAKSGDEYKVVDRKGTVKELTGAAMRTEIVLNRVANASYNLKQNKYTVQDTYEIIKDTEFEQEINEKYRQFIAKSKLMGMDNSFRYEIENGEVRLAEYTGKPGKVIIPNFVTIIKQRAFYNKGVTEIKIGIAVKFIGDEAFERNEISAVEIPESVITMANTAFKSNKRSLYLGSVNFNRDNFKFLGDNTTILHIGFRVR